MEHVIRVTLTDTTSAVGWIIDPRAPAAELPLWGTKEGKTWHLYGGDSDQFRGEGNSVSVATRRLVKSITKEFQISGTAKLDNDWSDREQIITV
jgi:hypothetical protein